MGPFSKKCCGAQDLSTSCPGPQGGQHKAGIWNLAVAEPCHIDLGGLARHTMGRK